MRPSRRILTSYSKNAERSPGWVHEILNSQAETAARALEAEGAEVIFVDASRTTDDPSELISLNPPVHMRRVKPRMPT